MDLRRMRFLINRLPMARFRVEKAMSQATKCTASLTGMPRGGGGESQVERGIDLRLEAKAALKDIQDELAMMQAQLEPVIDLLTDPLARMAVRLRYIDRYSVRKIAYRLNYSEQHIFRVLSNAEKEIEEKLLPGAKDESHES